VTLLTVSLNMGAAFAHVLELPAKMRLDGRAYWQTQQIYRGFGPVGAILEPGSVLGSLGLAALVRERGPAFGLTGAGAGLLAAALAAWLALVSPMNARMATWEPDRLPDDWKRVRDQWEYAHAARFALQLTGFSALLLSVLLDRRGVEPATAVLPAPGVERPTIAA
jgi:hypothetical protein